MNFSPGQVFTYGKKLYNDVTDSPDAQNQALIDAQSAFIMEQLANNKELWPKMMDQIAANNGDIQASLAALSAQYPEIMGKITAGAQEYQGLADQASKGVAGAADAAQQYAADFSKGAGGIQGDQQALFDQLSQALSGSQNQLDTLSLPPEVAAMLDTIKNSQMQGLETGANKLVGSSVADLAKRGMMSSSTAEGSMGAINDTLAPYMAQIQAEDAKRRIDLPQQLASQKAGLAKDVFGAGTTTTGVDLNLLNAIFNANLTGANIAGQGAKDVFGIQSGANKNAVNSSVDALNLNKDLFNTTTNANQLQLSPWMQLYGATAGAGSANTAAPQYPQPSPFMQLLTAGAQGAGQGAGAAAASSRDFKDGIIIVSDAEDDALLEKVAATHLSRYRYKPDIAEIMGDGGREHIGLIVEDAPEELATAHRKAIDLYDMNAVLWAAVRSLHREVVKLRAMVEPVAVEVIL